ncbi:MAG TPA: hypothetical protein VFP88_09210 [Rhodanobacteraceae bacterium]|nr:hypothetical protein [Rhodanobacteraceae bacterium]
MLKVRGACVRVITLIAMGFLLGACGGEPGGDVPPASGATASSMANGSAEVPQANADGPSESDSADAQDEDSDDADARSNAQLDAMLDRKIPGGTLTYSFVETGHRSRTGMGIRHDSITINHRFSVTAHMRGVVGGATEQERHQDSTPTQLKGIQKAMDACGDDMACQQRAAMQVMQMSQEQMQDINRQSRENSARSYRNVTWSVDTCHGTARIDDSDIGDGLDTATEGEPQPVSWNDTTRGSSQFECTGPETGASTLVADGNSNHYDITLRGGTVQATDSHQGKPESRPHEITFQDFTATGLKFDSLDKPFTGSKTLHPDKTRTLVITWTFTPDAK